MNGANWRTTVAGVVVAIASIIHAYPAYFPDFLRDLAGFIIAGGMAALGVYAADKPKTGGSQ